MSDGLLPSSFRDPSGFLFCDGASIYRQVNMVYKDHYNHLMHSGLYQSLVDSNLLVSHEEVALAHAQSDSAYRIIQPEPIPFISYPYEWCFSQLKDAALATLRIQEKALDFSMSLKDCSAYNIQFSNGKPILIDTLSFEKYREGAPWVAYGQFCQHFLAPLALMSYTDIRLNQLLRVYIEGIPLGLTDSLLPRRAYLKLSLLLHIYLHGRSQQHYAKKPVDKSLVRPQFGLRSLRGLIESLNTAVRKLTWSPSGSEWAGYYLERESYKTSAMEHKKKLIAAFLDEVKPVVVWDLGANTGVLSRIASDNGAQTISFDIDPACVEANYRASVAKRESKLLPLLLDVTNPSPGIGWDNQERLTLVERGPADTALALALIHHLAISNNVPLDRIASFFGKICRSLIIEFVPKTDPQVRMLLLTREDIFLNYTQQAFEDAFRRFFTVQQAVRAKDSERTLYLMRRERKG